MKSSLTNFSGDESFCNLIGRKEVEFLSHSEIKAVYHDARILIMGAAGSVGSSLARTLAKSGIQNVFYFDRDETTLHDLSLEILNTAAADSGKCFLGDIRDPESIRSAFEFFRPTIVINAAALKHLAILELHPREGFLTNIVGTLNLARICKEQSIKQFINISTDKAANPTSILGKTKKLGELIIEECFYNSEIKYCSVRFGNVFASRGSVLETFIHQIQNKKPVTITDKKVSRFFMSHNEAANLVLSAGTLNKNGIYIQNMGQEVLIVDLVNRLSQYLNVTPEIQLIGLKNGEKITEELYDSEFEPTKLPNINRISHIPRLGLLKELRNLSPKDNLEAVVIINSLLANFVNETR
jgi:FlaA1/EpsC-like NDP-sugar epimerase